MHLLLPCRKGRCGAAGASGESAAAPASVTSQTQKASVLHLPPCFLPLVSPISPLNRRFQEEHSAQILLGFTAHPALREFSRQAHSSSLPASSPLPGASPARPGTRQHAHPQPKEAAGKRASSFWPLVLHPRLSPGLTRTICPGTDQNPATQGSSSTCPLPSAPRAKHTAAESQATSAPVVPHIPAWEASPGRSSPAAPR